MDDLKRKLMLRESASRLRAAQVLRDSMDDGDSDYLLRLLAFELLLKIVFELHTRRVPPKHHRYAEIFDALPSNIQFELLDLANKRLGPSELVNNAHRVLTELRNNFIDLRYPYDKYAGVSEAEYLATGDDWIRRGAIPADATFRYFPQELRGLIYSAQQIAQR